MISVAKRLQQTQEYYFSKKLQEIARMNKEGENVINLGIGSPDLPPHERVIKTLQQSAQQAGNHGYQPYKGIPALREAFSQWYKDKYKVELDPETEILPLIGSKEGIMHISMTFLEEGDEVLVPDPGYPTYSSAAQLSGATIKKYDLLSEHNWQPDLKKLQSQNLEKVKIMWVNYPHMPTGKAADIKVFEELVAFAKNNNILICHDNPYSFIQNDHPQSLLAIEGAKEVVLELNSLSKSHNMAGWRIGMLAGKAEYLNNTIRFKSNMDSGMFLPMQLAAVEALKLNDDWYASINKIYTERRNKVEELLELINCIYEPDQRGMFVWAKVPVDCKDGYAMSDEILYNAKVFITPGGIFGKNGEGYIRISLCQKVKIYEEAMRRIKSTIN